MVKLSEFTVTPQFVISSLGSWPKRNGFVYCVSWLSVNENNEHLWAGLCGGVNVEKGPSAASGQKPVPLQDI